LALLQLYILQVTRQDKSSQVIDVGDLNQDNIPEILAGAVSFAPMVYIFSDVELDSYMTVIEDTHQYKSVVSLRTVTYEDSSVTFLGCDESYDFYNDGSIYRGTGYLEEIVKLPFYGYIPQRIDFEDINGNDSSELIIGQFEAHGMMGMYGTSADIVIRNHQADTVNQHKSPLFSFDMDHATNGGFTSLEIGNCDSDSALEILGSAFVDTCFPVYVDTCCLTVLSAVDGSTKTEQWKLTYYDTVNIISGIGLVDYNHDGVNEVLVAHKNAPMELLNGEDGSKIAESDSSYKVSQFAFGDVDGDGEKEIVIGDGNVLRVFEVDFTTDVPEEEKDLVISNFIYLDQNYPNPFNYTTLIHFKVNCSQSTVRGPVPTTLKIYNILGQQVKTLLDEEKIPGNYQVIWDGKDYKGKIVPSGIYFYQLTMGKYSESKKMLFLK